VLALSIAYAYFGQLPIVEAAFIGIKAAVLVIVIEALLSWASPRRHRGRSSSSPSSSASSPTSARAASRNWPSAFSALPSRCGRPSRSAFSGSSPGALYRALEPKLPTCRRTRRRHRRGGQRDPESEPLVRTSVVFGKVAATRYGPLQVWTPECASLNIVALTLAILAAALQFGLRLRIAGTLAVSAGAALTWSLIQSCV
jgi:uncharacterized protein YjeT (DUF2065 family)